MKWFLRKFQSYFAGTPCFYLSCHGNINYFRQKVKKYFSAA